MIQWYEGGHEERTEFALMDYLVKIFIVQYHNIIMQRKLKNAIQTPHFYMDSDKKCQIISKNVKLLSNNVKKCHENVRLKMTQSM